jgi:hypothetical protein
LGSSPTIGWTALVIEFAKAVSVAEGFGRPGKIPTIANNPCDLELGDAGSFRTDGTLGEGIAKFVELSDGWQAAYHKFNRILSGRSAVYPLTMTLAAMGLKYSDGDVNWAKNVGAELTVPVSMTLAEIKQSRGAGGDPGQGS